MLKFLERSQFRKKWLFADWGSEVSIYCFYEDSSKTHVLTKIFCQDIFSVDINPGKIIQLMVNTLVLRRWCAFDELSKPILSQPKHAGREKNGSLAIQLFFWLKLNSINFTVCHYYSVDCLGEVVNAVAQHV